ncbi:MAG TPA: glycerophosphodiester phosphodiesterase family protein [Rhizomicrobium sp.]
MRHRGVWLLAAGGLFLLGVDLLNASWLAAPPAGARIGLIAHRGAHQSFDLSGVSRDTCTATRIRAPIMPQIENTLASMRAAYAAGAEVVEIDVHPTTDGGFAVFHDWTLDCRTNGHGVTRAHAMAYLKTLDVGYGYSADGGKTFPLRGRGIGLMPSLADVLTAFPDGRFFVNFKSNDAREGDRLAAILHAHPAWRRRVWGVYGGDGPTDRAMRLIPGLRGYSISSIESCLVPYFAWGWSGFVPAACRHAIVPLPINIAPWLWGWPYRFEARMRAAGSTLVLIGPYHRGDAGSSGIDGAEDVARIPRSFDGFVSTNEIGTVAPLLARRQSARTISSSR